MNICVLGAGAFGTAWATILAHNGHRVKIWCYEPDVVYSIEKKRCNDRYLPGIELDKKIVATSDLQEALSDAHVVFEATPIQFLRTVLDNCVPFFSQQQIWVVLSKGIENKTLLLPGQIIDDVFGCIVAKAVVSGPSFARYLANKELTGLTIASQDGKIRTKLQQMLINDFIRTDLSDDPVGVQVAGALKNVMTLAVGMINGAGCTDNTKAFLFTRALQEITKTMPILGGKTETLYGLAGIGDIVLTSMGKLSRNLTVGERLGQGHSISQILEETGLIPEGINTVRSIEQLCQKKNLRLPVLSGIHNVIFEKKSVQELVQDIV